jgi:hypothetical protein
VTARGQSRGIKVAVALGYVESVDVQISDALDQVRRILVVVTV